jgi:hypothetical protein
LGHYIGEKNEICRKEWRYIMAESRVAGVFSSAEEVISKIGDAASAKRFIVVSRDGEQASKVKGETGVRLEIINDSAADDTPVFRNLATAFEQDGEDTDRSSDLGRLTELGLSILDAREVLGYAEDGLLVLVKAS